MVLQTPSAIRFRLTWKDYVRVFTYNFTEPVIGATALAICAQQPSLSSLLYILLVVSLLLPMTLTARTGLIQLKVCLSTLIFILAIALTTLKAYILSVIDDSQHSSTEDWVEKRLGI